MTITKHRSAMLLAVPLGLVASGVLVYQSSSAAFTQSASTATQTWSAGTVTLPGSVTAAVAWSALTDLQPTGTPVTRCFFVDYTGNLAADISLYPTNYTHSNGSGSSNLENNLQFTVAAYDGDQTDSNTATGCAASLTNSRTLTNAVSAETAAAFGARVYGTGATTSVTGPQPLTYEITYVLPANTSNDAQGDNVAFNFTWEAQNT